MKFYSSTLFVKDMEESIWFYQEIIGLPVSRRFNPSPDMEIVFLGENGTQIELIQDKGKEVIEIGPDISWAFTVDSLEAAYQSMKDKGVTILSDIIQPSPHVKFFYIQDPNGMKIQLVENL